MPKLLNLSQIEGGKILRNFLTAYPASQTTTKIEKKDKTLYSAEELLSELKKSPICHKVTLSGGDPLYQNEDELLEFISLMKKNDYTKIIIYTGFTMEEVIDRLHLNHTISDFKSYVLDDITLITDPFVESLKSYSTRFRGSSNQRVFHLTSSLDSHTVSVDEVTHKYPWEFVDHPVSVYCI